MCPKADQFTICHLPARPYFNLVLRRGVHRPRCKHLAVPPSLRAASRHAYMRRVCGNPNFRHAWISRWPLAWPGSARNRRTAPIIAARLRGRVGRARGEPAASAAYDVGVERRLRRRQRMVPVYRSDTLCSAHTDAPLLFYCTVL